MLMRFVEKSFKINGTLLKIIAGCSIGFLVGISLWVSPYIVPGVLAAVLIVVVILEKPEIVLLGILVATSSIVFENQLPMISVGISLHMSDFLLLGALGLIVVRWLAKPGFKIVQTPLDWPLWVFYGVTLFWTFNAILHSTVDIESARRGIRFLSYYLTFFIVTNLVRERRQLNFLLNGFFFLATVVASVMVAQYVLGDTVTLLPGRVENLSTQGDSFSDVTRMLPPGISVVLVAFVTVFCVLILEKFKTTGWLKVLQFGLFGLAFLFTFLRSYWTALIIVSLIFAFILKGHDRQKLIGWMVVMCAAVVILQLVPSTPNSATAKLLNASANRLSTVINIGTFKGQDSSLNYRKIEIGYAFSHILSHPLTGLGISGNYRPLDSRLDQNGGDGRNFIHNGHLLILLQSGLFGYLGLMWLSLAFLIRGFKHWRSIANSRLRGVVIGFTLTYLAILLAAIVNSTFMQWYWTPVIGFMMAVNEVIILRFKD